MDPNDIAKALSDKMRQDLFIEIVNNLTAQMVKGLTTFDEYRQELLCLAAESLNSD